jgi:hypothetical protein
MPYARPHSIFRAVVLISSGRAVAESATTALLLLSLRNGNNVDGDRIELMNLVSICNPLQVADLAKTHAEVLQQILCLNINIQLSAFRVLGEIERRNLRHVLILSLSLLLLQFERYTANGTTLNTLHQMSREAGNLLIPTVRNSSSRSPQSHSLLPELVSF